jgi:serine dehydrogenase proteinase
MGPLCHPNAVLGDHDYPITFEQAKSLGLPVREELPADVYALMDLCPQPRQDRPSVQLVPVPYRREPEPTTQRPR